MAKTTRPRNKKQDEVVQPGESENIEIVSDASADLAEVTEPQAAEETPEVLDAVILEESDPTPSAPVETAIEPVPEEKPSKQESVQTSPNAGSKTEKTQRPSLLLSVVPSAVIAAATAYLVTSYVPQQATVGTDQAALESLKSDLTAQASAIDALKALGPKIADLETRLSALETATPAPTAGLQDVEGAVANLESRISALEAQPAPSAGEVTDGSMKAALDTLQAEVEALKGQGDAAAATIAAAAAEAEARLAEAEAQAAALKAEAEETARKAVQSAAIGRIQAALDSGAPFVSALADLHGLEIPAGLTDVAEAGVPTIRALSEAFPAAARESLDASRRATMGDSISDRLSSFLETATGSRSLAPREGSDPDAVLSRAEAAVQIGDLPAALAEIAALPEAGQAPLADWVAMAQKRLDAVSALASLTAAISG